MSEKASRPAIGIGWRLLAALLGAGLMGFGAFAFISEGEAALATVGVGTGAVLISLSVFGVPVIEGLLRGGGEFEWAGAKAKLPAPPREAPSEVAEKETAGSGEAPPRHEETGTPAGEEEARKDVFIEAIDAMHDGNLQKFDELWTKFIDEAPDDNQRLSRRAFRLSTLYTRGGKTWAFEELISLAEQNPNSLWPLRNLALCYEDARNHSEAAKLYDQARKNEKLSKDDRFTALQWEVDALLKAERYKDAESAAKEVSGLAETALERATIHKLLGQVCRSSGQMDEADWHYEKYLELNPADTQARFGLAHSYANRNMNHQALYHYQILVEAHDDSAAMNNLALIHEAFGMPISAVSLLKRSAGKAETIAFGNIARRLGEQGFDSEAEEWIRKARGHDDVHEYVDSAANQISKHKTSERERAQAVAKAASLERDFFFKRIEALRSGVKVDRAEVEGDWSISDTSMVMRVTPSDKGLTARFRDNVWDWELKGHLAGTIFTFNWNCDKTWENTSGDGMLIFDDNGAQFEAILRHTPQKGEIRAIRGTKATT
jgi:tetratricopeptide (TPR) repeat protein